MTPSTCNCNCKFTLSVKQKQNQKQNQKQLYGTYGYCSKSFYNVFLMSVYDYCFDSKQKSYTDMDT